MIRKNITVAKLIIILIILMWYLFEFKLSFQLKSNILFLSMHKRSHWFNIFDDQQINTTWSVSTMQYKDLFMNHSFFSHT